MLLYLGLPLRVLRSSELAASGESLPSSPNPLPPPDVELPADKSEDNSALRDALDPPPLPPAFLVVALLLSFFGSEEVLS